MNALPASIEAYLLEAGFSATEILILKRLLEEDALSLRELAAKTGKSTGVLDQAMRKLLRKNIVTREMMNGYPKFTLISLQSVVRWLSDDIREKRDLLLRKHQDFESFVASLRHDKRRPLMQYFEGEEGIKQAYMRLLHYGKEMLMYVPAAGHPQDDPLRDFRVQYFRERRSRGIFGRAIAHNTTFGRRFHSRDPFEYRETVLVAPDQYPFDFEKIIVGNVVACFNFAEKRACIIQYPEMASMEKILFDGIWHQAKQQGKKDSLESGPSAETVSVPPVPRVSLQTRVFSSLREFFLSKRSLQTFAVFGVLSAMITYGLYLHNWELNKQRALDKVLSIAATGAFQFDWRDLDALHAEADYRRPQWAKVVNQLKNIREQNRDIYFAYIFRKRGDGTSEMEFVADSHSLNPYANTDNDPTNDVDVNKNGVIDGPDVLQWPGQDYPDPPEAAFLADDEPIASKDFYEDEWGKVISGYAPIKNGSGQTVAVLAIDMQADDVTALTRNSFIPILYFIGFFVLFVFIRVAAFNRSLAKEVWHVFKLRRILIGIVICAECAAAITIILYWNNLQSVKHETGEKLMSIVATASTQIDGAKIANIHFAKDMHSQEYQEIFHYLNKIRGQNKDIKYIYILRPILRPNLFEFVVDADSNYFLPFLGKDFNSDGLLNDADENLAPGVQFYVSNHSKFDEGLIRPTYERNFQVDQWGTWMSGYAPIMSSGKVVGIIGADTDITEIYFNLKDKFIPWLWFLLIFCFLILSMILQIRLFKK